MHSPSNAPPLLAPDEPRRTARLRRFVGGRPLATLGMCLGATALAILTLVAVNGDTYRRIDRSHRTQMELQKTLGAITHLDDVLALIAQLAVTTGDTALQSRYERLGKDLASALHVADSLAPKAEAIEAARTMLSANERLGRLERAAFAHLRAGRHDSAHAVLHGQEYLSARREYEEGARVVTDSLRSHLSAEAAGYRSRAMIDLATAIAALLFIGFTWALLVALLGAYLGERREREAQLLAARDHAEAASKSKGEFLASMSHELRTPLGAIIGFANVLSKNKEGNLGARDLEYLARIQVNGKHLLSLINEVLDLAKVEARRMEIIMAPAAVEPLLRNAAALVEGRLEGREVALVVDVPRDTYVIDIDATRLTQVLVNLVGNAVKFTEHGSVTLRFVPPTATRSARIDVADTGAGIPAERLRAIFEPFEQADNTAARKYEGTGLGLAIARSLCEAMGCTLTVTSEVGVGSTFSIGLRGATHVPAAPLTTIDAGADEASVAASTGELAGRLLLVIDDNPDARLLIAKQMQEAGARVVAASAGEEGLRMARELRPDAITLDLVMPGLSGVDVLQRLKGDPQLCDIPVIVVSVAPEEHGSLLGAVDAITKPVERDTLIRALQRQFGVRGRVLVVDDDPDMQTLIGDYLREGGVGDVRMASNGAEAMAQLDSFAPDLIVLDLLMPQMDGLGFLRALRLDVRWYKLPVIVVTEKDLASWELRLLEKEALTVLRKGDSLEQRLLGLLRAVIPAPAATAR